MGAGSIGALAHDLPQLLASNQASSQASHQDNAEHSA